MESLVEVEHIATGTRALLPRDVAYLMTEAGRVRLVPDERYATPAPTPVLHTWTSGKFTPTRLTRRY